MEFAIIIAKVFAIYLVVSGAFLLVKGQTLPLLLKDFFKHPAIVYLTGIILIFLGSILLIRNHVFDRTWQTFITVFGLAALLKGIMYLFFPKTLADFPIKKFRDWFGLLGIVLILAGIYLFCIAGV